MTYFKDHRLKNAGEDAIHYRALKRIEDEGPVVPPSSAPPAPSSTINYSDPRYVSKPPVIEQNNELRRESYKRLNTRVEGNWRYSNDRSILMSEFWVPLAQNEIDGSVLFGDVRLMGDNNSNKEFNIGVGYREIVNTKLLGDAVAGGMVWYDRRFTARDSRFNQITVSGELLGEKWDIRANGYVPLNNSKNHTQANPNNSNAGFAGTQILVNTDQSVVEEALPGVDIEVGRKVDFLDKITDVTRIYAGAYHFEGDRVDNVSGLRARIASDISTDVQLGARYQYDDVRGSQTYLEATVRLPWGVKKSFKEEGVRSRLDEAPERDIDIVHNETVIDEGVNKVLFNANTQVAQNVVHVDNTAAGGGDGSFETPFDTLVAAEAAAVANDLIYIHRGDGTTTGQNSGIILNDPGQMLVGSGVDLLFNDQRFTTSNGLDIKNSVVVQASTANPVITNAAGSGVGATADGVFIAGITVDGANANGVFASNLSNANWSKGTTITNVTVLNSGNHGLSVQSDGVGSRIEKINISNNFTDNNGNRGVFVQTSNGASMFDVKINGNTANNNFFDGITIRANRGNSHVDKIYISNNIANNNGSRGIYTDAVNSGIADNVSISNNVATTNNLQGFFSSARNGLFGIGQLGEISYYDNQAINNVSHGFFSSAAQGEIQRVKYHNNVSQGNGEDGISLLAEENGNISQVAIENNTLILNVEHGLNFADESVAGGILNRNVQQNRIFSNTLEEVRVDLDGGELNAENNWWGTASGLLPAEVDLVDGTIDSTPFLTSDPGL